MIRNSQEGPALGTLLRKTCGTAFGALQNRGELFMVELQEERLRMLSLIVLGSAALFLGMMTLMLITGAIIFLVPEDYRLYAVAAFAVLYLGATVAAALAVRKLLKKIPFGDTLAEFKKDSELMEAFGE